MRVEWGDRGVSIDPQNTLPHVESIRNNLVFYPPLQKKRRVFWGSVCVSLCEYECVCEHERESEVGKGVERACFSKNLPEK